MAEIELYVNGTAIEVKKDHQLTTGMVGAKASFVFSEAWDGLTKTAVFRAGEVTRDVLNVGNEAQIPWEVLQTPGRNLYVGVYGTSADGTVVIPTKWGFAGMIYAGADPSGDTSTDKTMPVWAQLQAMIGDLAKLDTGAKESIVAAINEVSSMTLGGSVKEAVETYLAENPISAGVQTVPAYVRTAAEAVAEKMLGVYGGSSSEGSGGSEDSGGTEGLGGTGGSGSHEVPYTNQLPISTDTDGTIYNVTGYQAGYRLNSAGVPKEITETYYDSAVCVTGFIPCKLGDVIRIQGMVIDPADTQAGSYNIHLYDSSKAVLIFSPWSTLSDYAVVTTDSNGYIASITLSAGLNFGNENTAYIRLSAKNITADSVITVNEEIEAAAVALASETDEESASVVGGSVPFSLAFLTDLHWNDADESRYTAAAQALNVIAETAPLDLVCFGGDYIFNWSEETAANAREDIAQCRKAFADIQAPAIWLRGNHENNGYEGQRLTRQEIFSRVSRAQHTMNGFVSNPDDPYGCYGYLDFENVQVRVIAVNTGDNDEMGTTATASGNAADLISCHNISAKQLQWIADEALDLSGKEDPTEWTILVLSHIPIYSTSTWYNSHTYTDSDGATWTCNVQNLETLLAAYRDQGSFSVTLNGETASKDFSAVTPAGAVLFINGHAHAENQVTNNGFTYITCPNLCNNGEKASADGTTYAKTAAGTAGETAFTVLTVDSENRKVYAWIYGSGYDREIDF